MDPEQGVFIHTFTVNVLGSQTAITLQANAGSNFPLSALDIVPVFRVGVTAPPLLGAGASGIFQVSATGATGPNYNFALNFSDGTATQQANSSAASWSTIYAFAVNGQYSILARVTDSLGYFETAVTSVLVTGISVFHVSPDGDDTNDGSTARPWATVQGVMSHYQFGPGDQILFQGGATFTGSIHLDSSDLASTPANPLTIGSFGDGPATLAMTSTAEYDSELGILGAGGVHITGLNLVGPYTPDSPPDDSIHYQSGIQVYNTSLTQFQHIYIDHVNISGFAGNAIDFYASPGSSYHDIVITDCTISQMYGAGINIYSRFEQAYRFDDIYIARVQIVNNFASAGYHYSTFGCYLQNVQDVVVERCVAINNDETCPNPLGGGYGFEACFCNQVIFQYNEAAFNFSHGDEPDNGGFNFDAGAQNSLMQYNYSHDNDGPGFLLSQGLPNNGRNTGNIIRFNISQNDSRRNAYGGIALTQGDTLDSTIENAEIYNNVVYMTPNAPGQHVSALSIQDLITPIHVHIHNNVLVTTGDVPLVWVEYPETDLVFANNAYFPEPGYLPHFDWMAVDYVPTPYYGLDGPDGLRSVAPDFEMVGGVDVSFVGDPQLVNLGSGGTIDDPYHMPDHLPGYRVQPGSPVAGTGLNMVSSGVPWDEYHFAYDTFLSPHFNNTPTDFYGHSLLGRTSWGRGVDTE
jgi:hypothetical protein